MPWATSAATLMIDCLRLYSLSVSRSDGRAPDPRAALLAAGAAGANGDGSWSATAFSCSNERIWSTVARRSADARDTYRTKQKSVTRVAGLPLRARSALNNVHGPKGAHKEKCCCCGCNKMILK
jgi:hypothetical protein